MRQICFVSDVVVILEITLTKNFLKYKNKMSIISHNFRSLIDKSIISLLL